MIDRAIHAEPGSSAHDTALHLDERSMRILELGLAVIALVAAILLGVR